MPATKTTDHADQIVGGLLEQFKGKPRIEALLRVVAGKVQEIEDAFWQLMLERFLDTATGEQLDNLGRIVERDRADLGDDVYRGILRAKIAANLSSGTYPEVLRVVELATGLSATGRIEVVLEWPAAATIVMGLDPLPVGLGPHVADLIAIAASMGCRILFTYYQADVPTPFAFDDAAIGFDDADVGWGTTAEGA